MADRLSQFQQGLTAGQKQSNEQCWLHLIAELSAARRDKWEKLVKQLCIQQGQCRRRVRAAPSTRADCPDHGGAGCPPVAHRGLWQSRYPTHSSQRMPCRWIWSSCRSMLLPGTVALESNPHRAGFLAGTAHTWGRPTAEQSVPVGAVLYWSLQKQQAWIKTTFWAGRRQKSEAEPEKAAEMVGKSGLF